MQHDWAFGSSAHLLVDTVVNSSRHPVVDSCRHPDVDSSGHPFFDTGNNDLAALGMLVVASASMTHDQLQCLC